MLRLVLSARMVATHALKVLWISVDEAHLREDIQNNALKKHKKSAVTRGGRPRPLHAVSRLRIGKTPVSDARLPSPQGADLDFWKGASVFLAWLYFHLIPAPNTLYSTVAFFSEREREREGKNQADHMCIYKVYTLHSEVWLMGGKLLLANLPRSPSFLRKFFEVKQFLENACVGPNGCVSKNEFC